MCSTSTFLIFQGDKRGKFDKSFNFALVSNLFLHNEHNSSEKSKLIIYNILIEGKTIFGEIFTKTQYSVQYFR